MEGAWIVTDPLIILYKGEFLPVARVRIRRIVDRHVVLIDIVHHGEELTVRTEAGFMADALDVWKVDLPHIRVSTDLLDREIARRAFRIVQTSHRLPGLAVYDDGCGAHANDQG